MPTIHYRKQNTKFSLPAFTLVELIIVIAVIGILAAIAIPNYQKFISQSRMSEVPIILNQITSNQIHYFDTPSIASNFMILENQYAATAPGDGVPNIDLIGRTYTTANWNQYPFNTISLTGPDISYCSYAVTGDGSTPLQAIQISAACDMDEDNTSATHPAYTDTELNGFHLFISRITFSNKSHDVRPYREIDHD